MDDRLVIHFDDLLGDGAALSLLQENCVVANGCFDVLHLGHLSLLRELDRQARTCAMPAVVALNSDRSVRSLKGPSRPVVPQESRARLLSELRWPFVVVIFDDDTPQRLMDTLRPRVVVKGAEYSADSVIRWVNSMVVTVDMNPGWSTTGILLRSL